MLAVAFLFTRPPPTGGPPLRDFESYYAAGSVWAHGGDPYGREIWRVERTIPAVVATRDELLPFVGPAFVLPLWAQLARLSYDRAAIVWGVVLAASIATIALGSLILAGWQRSPVEAIAVLAFCAGFGPLTSGAALGQVAIVSCAAVIATTLSIRSSASATALSALVAALQPNVGVVLGAGLGPRRVWIGLVSAATVVVAGSMVALGGLPNFIRYLWLLREHGAAERFIAIQMTPAAVAHALGVPAMLAMWLGGAIAVLVFAATVGATRCWSYDGVARLAMASAALPLIVPFAHEHDFTIAFFPAILCLRRARRGLGVVAAAAAMLIAVDWLGLAQRPNGVLLTSLLTLGAALSLIALVPRRSALSYAAAIGAALVVYLVGMVARRHALPTWPDALPLHFTVDAHLTATMVWQLEQTACGIAAQDPWWGALRLLPLIGCVLLWSVAVVSLRTIRGGPDRLAT